MHTLLSYDHLRSGFMQDANEFKTESFKWSGYIINSLNSLESNSICVLRNRFISWKETSSWAERCLEGREKTLDFLFIRLYLDLWKSQQKHILAELISYRDKDQTDREELWEKLKTGPQWPSAYQCRVESTVNINTNLCLSFLQLGCSWAELLCEIC
jgi:hypothetical protein